MGNFSNGIAMQSGKKRNEKREGEANDILSLSPSLPAASPGGGGKGNSRAWAEWCWAEDGGILERSLPTPYFVRSAFIRPRPSSIPSHRLHTHFLTPSSTLLLPTLSVRMRTPHVQVHLNYSSSHQNLSKPCVTFIRRNLLTNKQRPNCD
jgi:hypothetical protein